MSDETSSDAPEGERKRPSIPAPTAVPRPASVPPGPMSEEAKTIRKRQDTLSPEASVPPPPPAVPEIVGDGTSKSPVSVPPPAAGADLGVSGVTADYDPRDTPEPEAKPGRAITADYDLQKAVEKFDPDEAPTMDYDPTAGGPLPTAAPAVTGYDPRARGVFAPIPASDRAPISDATPTPTSAELTALASTPSPTTDEASTSKKPLSDPPTKRRRSSRRTVKIPDDPVIRTPAPPSVEVVEAPPVEVTTAKPASEAPTNGPSAAAAVSASTEAKPASNDASSISTAVTKQAGDTGGDWPKDAAEALPMRADELADLADEEPDAVTIIKPMRIVSVGSSEPAPPSIEVEPASDPNATLDAALEAESAHRAQIDSDAEDITDQLEERLAESDEYPEIEEIEPDRMSNPAPKPRPPPPPPKAKKEGKRPPPPPQQAASPAQAAAAAMPTAPPLERPREKPWWEELFTDDILRTFDKPVPKHVHREVNFIEESLGVERGAVVLDLACGTGQHAVELASRGYNVVGYDLSLAMLARAADEAQEREQKINFLQGDMREMAFEEMFDGIYSWSTSFGYFDDERNAVVLQRVYRALRAGGMFLLDVVNRDYIAPRSPSLVWFEGDGCVAMDDMFVDFFASRLRVKRTIMFDDGRSKEIEYSIRLYGLHELGKLLHDTGFKVVEVTGHPAHPGVFFGSESPRMIILAEKAI